MTTIQKLKAEFKTPIHVNVQIHCLLQVMYIPLPRQHIGTLLMSNGATL